jgi:hypothetical protein
VAEGGQEEVSPHEPLPAELVRDPEEQARDVEIVNRQLREGLEQCGRDDGTEAAQAVLCVGMHVRSAVPGRRFDPDDGT